MFGLVKDIPKYFDIGTFGTTSKLITKITVLEFCQQSLSGSNALPVLPVLYVYRTVPYPKVLYKYVGESCSIP